MATFGFNTKGLNSEFQTKLVEMVNVWSVSIFPPNCRVELGDSLEENTSATFHVKLRDFQNLAPFEEIRLNETNMDVVVKDPIGNETKCWTEMKKGSTDELEVTVKPTMTGRHSLEIRILYRVVVHKEFESKPVEVEWSKEEASFQNRRTLTKNFPTPKEPAPLGTQKPDMTFDQDKAHKDVFVSADGKVFKNISAGDQKVFVPGSSRLQKYKGTLSLKGIRYPGRYYYAIKMNIKVKKTLDKSNLVYELGIARKSVIGKHLVVEGYKFAWSMIGAHHVDCDAICLHIAHNNPLLYHEVLLKNETGCNTEREFGFLLDTEFGQWKVFDHKLEKEMCVVASVDCSKFLYPVVAGFNPNYVEVTASFMDL
ncbi:uncharacterized protein LOC128163738 [Crassostrea angulata]|uniref:uncharacterized protein LOC128163738 n=1 Tax=Magallana angulata TaxID=2784310 RepID=UPI0022B20F93|nr:uncharacterized protein LOC128163738 [Crassostrea angulata]